MAPEWLVLLGLFAIATSAISMLVVFSLSYRMQKKVRKNQMLLETLRKDFNVICATATRASSRAMHVEKQLRKLGDRQEQIELRDPMNHSYGQAIAMAKKGMGVDELVNILGLPRGEAELIALMHNVKKAS